MCVLSALIHSNPYTDSTFHLLYYLDALVNSPHGAKECPVKTLSSLHIARGNQKNFACAYCGLPIQHLNIPFHNVGVVKGTRRCDSGFQDVCERFCWYQYWEAQPMITGPMSSLQHLTGATEPERFQLWLSGRGYLGYPWSNMVTLFMQILYPDSLVTKSS